MGCKQYARMLGLSRGYPYILYLSLSKWDAAPWLRLFHRAMFQRRHSEKIGGTMEPRHPDCHLMVRVFRAAHASISARVEVRRFRSEMGKFRRFSKGNFSTAESMAT